MGLITGRVKCFGTRGFGFILGNDGVEYFMDIGDVRWECPVAPGTRVAFVPTPRRRGPCAKDVQPLAHEQESSRGD